MIIPCACVSETVSAKRAVHGLLRRRQMIRWHRGDGYLGLHLGTSVRKRAPRNTNARKDGAGRKAPTVNRSTPRGRCVTAFPRGLHASSGLMSGRRVSEDPCSLPNVMILLHADTCLCDVLFGRSVSRMFGTGNTVDRSPATYSCTARRTLTDRRGSRSWRSSCSSYAFETAARHGSRPDDGGVAPPRWGEPPLQRRGHRLQYRSSVNGCGERKTADRWLATICRTAVPRLRRFDGRHSIGV